MKRIKWRKKRKKKKTSMRLSTSADYTDLIDETKTSKKIRLKFSWIYRYCTIHRLIFCRCAFLILSIKFWARECSSCTSCMYCTCTGRYVTWKNVRFPIFIDFIKLMKMRYWPWPPWLFSCRMIDHNWWWKKKLEIFLHPSFSNWLAKKTLTLQ